MDAEYDIAATNGGGAYLECGLSLRLVKDSTTLTEGQTGVYKGNDGTYYRTVCIAGLEVLAENLAETLFRDGSEIEEKTGDMAWAAAVTAMRCDYNNDPTNVFI